MNALDLQSDYLLLEDATRSVDGIVNYGKGLRKSTFYSMARMKIKSAANKRNIDLNYLPKSFSRHRKNTTYYHWKSDKLFWKLEWIFPEADMLSIVDERVPEEDLILNILDKYVKFENCDMNLRKVLMPYLEADENEILVLLKLEKFSTKAFIEVDKNDSLMENLSLQSIIEYPIFYVILKRSSSEYNIVKRENRSLKFSNNYKGTNLLFGAVDEKQQ
ncbi:box C/D snoRNA protein 1-like [Halyomorpha halys]|uniref:box C/D snoRNA protein 1-like n=1 Tax=Halyomorpha halys TaxID=286706 RepID=UPI0034D2C5D2